MTQISRFWYGDTTGDAGTYDDDQFSKVIESLTYNHKQTNSLAIGGIDGTATSGSYPLKVYENSPTAMNVKVDKGSYWFLGRLYLSDAIETITIDSNSTGNPRIDSIILEADYTAQTIRLGIVKGTPASSPVAPTLTQTIGTLYQYKLADVAVANGATTIVNANITNTGATNYYGGNTYTTSSNMWTGNTNINVTITGSTSDILTGLSITLTPYKGSVMCLFLAEDGGNSSVDINYGYKVNSGSITYSTQDTASYPRLNLYTITGLTVGESNTITFYVKKNTAGNATLFTARATLWEMVN